MLKAVKQYLRDEALPRWSKVVFTWECLVTGIVIGVFAKYGGLLFALYPRVSDITTGLIAYASIALGFCIAGLTISLTFPDAKFTTHMSELSGKTSPYSDLLFVFSWTAIAHWCAVVAMFVVILLADGSQSLLPPGHSAFRIWTVSLLAGLCAYCLCQFLITLITLSQVGSAYIKFLRSAR
jgi:hypothetical protein